MSTKHGSALELGLALIQAKLGQMMGDPGFGASGAETELPRTEEQTLSKAKKVRTPKIVRVPVD